MTLWDRVDLDCGAVYVPYKSALTDEAKETICHICYYMNGERGFVLYGDREGVVVEAGSLEDMLEAAADRADDVVGSMPDFNPCDMDDGCGMLFMRTYAFAFRPFGLHGDLPAAMEARAALLEACEEKKVVAVVWCDPEEAPKPLDLDDILAMDLNSEETRRFIDSLTEEELGELRKALTEIAESEENGEGAR